MTEKMKRMYVSSLMYYIEQEYDNIPEEVNEDMENYFLNCAEKMICFPNAAGKFARKFLISNE